MRHSLQAKLLIFGLVCFLLTVGSSAVQITQFRAIAHDADRVQQQYDVANADAARLREELIRLIARIKDVWLRGGKTDSIDAVAGLVEETWQATNTLRANLESDVRITPSMRGFLNQYDATMTDYRASYLQTLATYRIDSVGPDGANADTRADSTLKGKGLAASGLVGDFQDEVRAATTQVRVHRRASIVTAERVTIAEAAVLLAMIAAVGLWLVRSIGRGVGDVAAAASAVSQGARNIAVPVRGKGELAQLATTFNAMVTELGTQERQLEELRRIAVALTGATTQREVCEIAVNGLADTFGYRYVSLYLIRPGNEGNLWLIHQRGYMTVIDPIPVDGTVTGRTVRERRSILVADSRLDHDFIAAEQQIVCEACAPILTPDRVLGTLLLEEESVGKLTAADLNLITTVANNVSVALENVRLNDEARTRVAHLARANQELASANALKSEFLATMSHELRTPLNAIIGFSELLSDGIVTEPAEMQACLADILNSGRHLLSLINDVLDISKIEAGRMELKPTVFDVCEEVREVTRSVAPLVAARGHTLSVEGMDVEHAVYADRQRVRQIILNLVSNAVKFTPDSGAIRISVSHDGPPANTVSIAMCDTGIGIRPEDFPKLFEKFRQLDSAHNRRYEGTGLGLALTRQLVELSGGTIAVTSTVGVGSTFTFSLPAAGTGRTEIASSDAVSAVAD